MLDEKNLFWRNKLILHGKKPLHCNLIPPTFLFLDSNRLVVHLTLSGLLKSMECGKNASCTLKKMLNIYWVNGAKVSFLEGLLIIHTLKLTLN